MAAEYTNLGLNESDDISPDETPEMPQVAEHRGLPDAEFFKEHLSHEEYARLVEIFEKTDTTQHEGMDYNQEFDNLKQRLNGHSQFLHRLQKQISNLKFSYQQKLLDVSKVLDSADCFNKHIPPLESDEEYAVYKDNITKKIHELQNRCQHQVDKNHDVAENYEKALTNVVKTLQDIESGAYHSEKMD